MSGEMLDTPGLVAPFFINPGNGTFGYKDGSGNIRMQMQATATVVAFNLYNAAGAVLFQYTETDGVGGSLIITQGSQVVQFFLSGTSLISTLPGLPTSNPNTAGQVWSNSKVLNICDNGTQQVETATVAETVDGVLTAGNVAVTITANNVSGSPLTVQVAAATNDNANTVAGKIRTALALVSAITSVFTVSGATNKVILTATSALANDATLNIATADGTTVGIAAAASSANTTAGAVPS